MKKNNIIVLAISAVAAAFLLWLWFYLGFNRIDNPLDLVLAIVWWVGIAALVALISYLERKRQRQIRTIYVSPTALYNSEKGIVALKEASSVEAMEGILQQLEYNFDKADLPSKKTFDYRFVVQTNEYKENDSDSMEGESSEPKWTGKVIKIDRENGNTETDFASIQELRTALAA